MLFGVCQICRHPSTLAKLIFRTFCLKSDNLRTFVPMETFISYSILTKCRIAPHIIMCYLFTFNRTILRVVVVTRSWHRNGASNENPLRLCNTNGMVLRNTTIFPRSLALFVRGGFAVSFRWIILTTGKRTGERHRCRIRSFGLVTFTKWL